MNAPRLQLSISAKDLKNIAGFLNKSDPFAIVAVRGDNRNNSPTLLGHTEVRFNDLNPSFSTVLVLEGYKLGVPLYIEVGIFDFNSKEMGLSEYNLAKHSSEMLVGLCQSAFQHKVMGTALFEVGEILGSRGNVGSKRLQFGRGTVYVHVERSRQGARSGQINFQLRGSGLKNKQRFGRKSSTYFEIFRRVEKQVGVRWNSVYKSNVVRSNLNPIWEETTLGLETFCNDDLNCIVKVVVYDYRRNAADRRIIGEFESSVQNLLDATQGNQRYSFDLIGTDFKTSGMVHVVKARVINIEQGGDSDIGKGQQMHRPPLSSTKVVSELSTPPLVAVPASEPVQEIPEFIDYLSGGCKISLAIAIDYTASNGDPRRQGTPHFFHPEAPNEFNDYEKAIFAVGSILAKYDADQMFPVWGFGAKYDNIVRHCFQCGDDVEVNGVHGILDAYRGVFRTEPTFSYPTDFTKVIGTASEYARIEQTNAEKEGLLSYTILLLLTAGNIENVQETREALEEASKTSPLSVVIVGIGDADFSAMDFLDDYGSQDDSNSSRDITKFVQFNHYKSYNALTEEVLDEIPDQLVSYYYHERGIYPGAPEDTNYDELEVQSADDDDRTVTYFDNINT